MKYSGEDFYWSFERLLDQESVSEYSDFGWKIVNTIPEWVNDAGLTRLWCWLQDRGVIRRG